jgi:hypothetical protein
MNTQLVFPKNIRRAVSAAESEIGGLFLFEKKPNRVVSANAVVFAEGEERAVQFTGLLGKFDDHNEWVIFHIHPPNNVSWNGPSASDMAMQLYFNVVVGKPAPAVFSMIFTPKTAVFTLITGTGYAAILKLGSAYLRAFPGSTTVDFLNGMMVFFQMCERAFTTMSALQKLSDAYVFDTFLDKITFNPKGDIFRRQCEQLTVYLSDSDRQAFWAHPFVQWYFRDGPNAPGLVDSNMGLFYSWVEDYDRFMSRGSFILGDKGYVYNSITPWSNLTGVKKLTEKEADMFNETDTEMLGGGKKRRKTRRGGNLDKHIHAANKSARMAEAEDAKEHRHHIRDIHKTIRAENRDMIRHIREANRSARVAARLHAGRKTRRRN